VKGDTQIARKATKDIFIIILKEKGYTIAQARQFSEDYPKTKYWKKIENRIKKVIKQSRRHVIRK
jgi:hypothetical protein